MLLASMMLIESWWYLWGVCQWWSLWDWWGDMLWLGLQLGLWEMLQLWLWWWHDCLPGDLLLVLLLFLWGLFCPHLRVFLCCLVSCFSVYIEQCSGLSHHRCSTASHMQATCWGAACNCTYCSVLGWLGHWYGWKMLRQWLLRWTWGWLFPSPWLFGTVCILIPATCSGRRGTGSWAWPGPPGRSTLWPCASTLHAVGTWSSAFLGFGHGETYT